MENETKICPACRETIKKTARKCRHCGEYLVTCSYCGAETAQGFKYCHVCGESIKVEVSPPEPSIPSTPRTYYPPSVNTSGGNNDTHKSSVGTTRVVVSNESFVGRAFIAWILYYIGFYIIGLILNIAWLSGANGIKRRTGTSPSGRGCLIFLMVTHFWIPLIAIIVLLILASTAGVGLWEYISELFGF